jgi:hypothetical protein
MFEMTRLMLSFVSSVRQVLGGIDGNDEYAGEYAVIMTTTMMDATPDSCTMVLILILPRQQ